MLWRTDWLPSAMRHMPRWLTAASGPAASSYGVGGGILAEKGSVVAHRFYSGVDRERASAAIPSIGNGMDLVSITGILMDQYGGRSVEEFKNLEIDVDEINRRLRQLPSVPDERLR